MGISVITRNNQVTLPKDIRELKGLHIGDTVLFVPTERGIDLVKLDKNIVKKTAGLWKSKGTGVAYELELRKEWERRA